MRIESKRIAAYVLFLSVCATVSTAAAQSTGTVRGRVTDESGGALPGASVVLTNQSNGQVTTVVTTEAGAYTLAFVPPAQYQLTVELSGFRSFATTVVVNVAGVVTQDVVLALGGVEETVTVEAQASLIQRDTAALGGLVDNTMMTAVPLSNRNFTQVLALSPGVVGGLTDAGALGRNSVNISANGARPWENSVVLDGMVADNPMSLGFDDANDKTGIPVPSPDAIQEFRVQTGLYDAEFGRQGGAVVNVVTKSGTNRFQGSAFEFFRDDAMNANEFFRNRGGQPKPELKQNQFGGTFGGPIKRDRLFFFASYQGTTQRNGLAGAATSSVFLPPLGNRTAADLGRLYGGRSGLFGGAAVAADGSNIHPTALAILNSRFPNGNHVIPDPQSVQANGTGFSVFSIPATYKEHQIQASSDYMPKAGHRVALKMFFATLPADLAFSGANLPGFGERNEKSNLNLSASHTWVMSGTTVNEFRVGYSRNKLRQFPIEDLTAGDVGMQSPVAGIDGVAGISVSGLFSIGPPANNDQWTFIDSYEVANTLSMTRGRHALRVGGSLNSVLVDRWDAYLTRGSLTFASFPDFLLGMSASQNGSSNSNIQSTQVANGLAQRYPRFLNLSAFAQDDVRVSDRLALNLGLRWQFNSQPWDRDGKLGGFDRRLVPEFTLPPPGGTFVGFTLPSEADLGGQPLPPGVVQLPYNRLVDDENWLGFSPRIGGTWRPKAAWNDFIIRAGYGLFYSAVAGTVTEQAFFDPWYVLLTGGGATTPEANFQTPFPGVPQVSEFPVYLPYTFPPTRSIFILDPELKQPFTQQWSANVQGQLGTWLFEFAYVGSKGSNLMAFMLPNQALLASPSNPVNGETTNTLANRNLRVPYLGWAPNGIQEIQSDGFGSTYQSFQTSASKRYGQGLSLRASYTLSRSRDNLNAAQGGRNQPLGGYIGDYYNREGNWGLASFDRTHRLVASFFWELPGVGAQGSFSNRLLGGWSVSGVATVQSGTPFSVTDNRAGTIYGRNSYAQLAPGVSADDVAKSGSVKDRLNAYFDTSAFGPPPVIGNGTGFGNAPRNFLRGPGQTNLDIAISKAITLGGPRRIELRAEAFNALNTTNFGTPGSNAANAASFGVISTTVGSPRVMQLAVKYRF